MNARIALCPRDNFDETLRVSEAARSGCVAIAERLAARWYNHGSPVAEVERWRSLPDVIRWLLADPEGLAERAEQMVPWWESCLCERAVAAFIASKLGDPVARSGPVTTRH
jgi:hypothetical protein